MSRAVELMKEWADLHRQHAVAKATATAWKQKMDEMAADVILAMADEGVSKATIAGVGTVFAQTTIRASAVDHEALATALEAAGVHNLAKITVNSTTLAGYVRDMVKAAEDHGEHPETPADALPPTIAEWVKITEIPELRLRAS